VIQAEVRRLAKALRPYRVLHRDALERTAGATSRHEGGFERALTAAVRVGAIKRLPAEFYGCPDGGLDPTRESLQLHPRTGSHDR
jgi:hypothetical protein